MSTKTTPTLMSGLLLTLHAGRMLSEYCVISNCTGVVVLVSRQICLDMLG
jgi:hypothetical protein